MVSCYYVIISVNFLISLCVIPTTSSTFCYPVTSAVGGTVFLSSAYILFVVREVRFVVFAVIVLMLLSCSRFCLALWLGVRVR
jgi:hypothetical protein